MGLAKKIETVAFLMDSFSAGRADLEDLARKIKGDWDMEEDAYTFHFVVGMMNIDKKR